MIKCRECTAQNVSGALFCIECGAFIAELDESSTAVLPFSDFIHRAPPSTEITTTAHLQAESVDQITIVIPSSRQRLKLAAQGDIQVGRANPDLDLFPELDLTPFEGAEKGVSRLHAMIRNGEKGISLIDLNSTNGTLLNMFRLPPEEAYPLHDGDEIRFGDLLIHIFFD
jgi:pSer/pThr/pTyr-binding forkhead associated (FHA) protein